MDWGWQCISSILFHNSIQRTPLKYGVEKEWYCKQQWILEHTDTSIHPKVSYYTCGRHYFLILSFSFPMNGDGSRIVVAHRRWLGLRWGSRVDVEQRQRSLTHACTIAWGRKAMEGERELTKASCSDVSRWPSLT